MRKNRWMCEKFSQFTKVSSACFVVCVQYVFCANDLRPICNRIQCPRFSWFRITTRLRWSIARHRAMGVSPFLFCHWSILISRLVSRKLNHCAIDENDGSLCRKFMRCKILAMHSLSKQRWFNFRRLSFSVSSMKLREKLYIINFT